MKNKNTHFVRFHYNATKNSINMHHRRGSPAPVGKRALIKWMLINTGITQIKKKKRGLVMWMYKPFLCRVVEGDLQSWTTVNASQLHLTLWRLITTKLEPQKYGNQQKGCSWWTKCVFTVHCKVRRWSYTWESGKKHREQFVFVDLSWCHWREDMKDHQVWRWMTPPPPSSSIN